MARVLDLPMSKAEGVTSDPSKDGHGPPIFGLAWCQFQPVSSAVSSGFLSVQNRIFGRESQKRKVTSLVAPTVSLSHIAQLRKQ